MTKAKKMEKVKIPLNQEIKNAVVSAIEPFAKAVQTDLRHFGVMLEDSEKRWDLIAEQYDGIVERLVQLDDRVSVLENKVDSGQLANNVKFEELEKKLEVLHIDLVKIEDTLTRKADKDVFELLKQRVGGLEARMAKRK